jgi:hypothetical protein
MAKALPKPVVVKRTLQQYQRGKSGGSSEAGMCPCPLHHVRHGTAKTTREITCTDAHVMF